MPDLFLGSTQGIKAPEPFIEIGEAGLFGAGMLRCHGHFQWCLDAGQSACERGNVTVVQDAECTATLPFRLRRDGVPGGRPLPSAAA